MELDPKLPAYSTGDPTSFAYPTARERWPIIITQAIDDVYRTVGVSDDGEKSAEGKKILAELAQLKYEVQHDRALTPIRDDGYADVAGYNKELEQLSPLTWLKAPWLFTECYLFRRMSTSFTLSTRWKTYDVFARQKIKTFRSSRPAVLELAARYKDLVTQLRTKSSTTPHDPDADRLLFAEMCEVCLWGNATDLSLLTSLTYEDIQKLQGSEARLAAEKNILVNDLPAVHEHLLAAKNDPAKKNKERRVDIVLDNAGFELYVDLVLAGDEDVLQGKTPVGLSEKEVGELEFLFAEWSRFHAEGMLMMRPNRAWTGPGSFWRLPEEEKEVVGDFKEAELVVFKGDLNYRKLVGDVAWDATTPFTEAIGPLGPGSGVNVLALRTCKADVVVGLKSGEDEKLKAMEGGGGDSGARKWAWNGKWAVVSFSKGT
ncbi:Hairy/enhancer-of-split with YRPW motif protein 2 [Collariella sp. IMI 366227]|nr:Hairy/enhancer-of-split with YRPW motif protein 2 [Collariella sp. IMI 366227]